MQKNPIRLAALLALTLGACGGDYQPVDQSHSGELADGDAQHAGRTCDAYEISVGRGWHVTAEMTSDWDNYLYLAKGEDVASNDDTNGTNARIDTDVEMAGMYTVYACAYADGRGAYTLHITTREGS
ncbi:MAG: hypothetical protein M5U28_15290 [Sandaracinaceae bacterium]|nr:hypothetical protein [Sandaracinaceae bacterium]